MIVLNEQIRGNNFFVTLVKLQYCQMFQNLAHVHQ